MEMPYDLIEQVGATYGDSEGMADLTIIAEGVEVGILMKYSPAQTHFSLRSRGRVDVGKIAKRNEGGGHSSAAGCTMNLPLFEAKTENARYHRKGARLIRGRLPFNRQARGPYVVRCCQACAVVLQAL